METVKIWILESDLNKVMNGKKPDKYWVTKPEQKNLVEISIKTEQLQTWQSPKQMLFD